MASISNLSQMLDGFWLDGVASWSVWPARVRRVLLNLGGMHVGSSGILRGQHFSSGHRVSIGDGCFVNIGCIFDSAASITIGDDVHLGPGVALLTSAHTIGPATRRAGANRPQAIVVHDGVWIGARATVMPGVTIGSGCVIAAGAIVTRDTEANGVYAGVPARHLREAEEAAATAG